MIYIKKASDYRLKELSLESRVIYNRLTWLDKLYLRKISKLLDNELSFDSTLMVYFNRKVSLALQEFLESRGYEVWVMNYLKTTHIRLKKEHIKPESFTDNDIVEEIFDKMKKRHFDKMRKRHEEVQDNPIEVKGTVKFNLKSSDAEIFKTATADIDLKDDTLQVTILENAGTISDGYHTFNELYDFRLQYNAAMANLLHYTKQCTVYKSRKHSDGELCFGGSWFVVYIITPFGQISNHYHMENWDYFDIPERELAEEWDGHNPEDVLYRLKKFNSSFNTMISKTLNSINNKEEQNGNQDTKG